MVTPRYDAVAEFYENFAPDRYDDPPQAALLRLLGDISGIRVLDLACGHGRLTRELARRGARVVGMDLSSALLERARLREQTEPLGIAYVQADAAAPQALAGEAFDAVTCNFGLSDIDDLDGAIATVARILRGGGIFVFSFLHPCFPGSPANGANPSWQPRKGYFAEGWWRADGPPHGLRPRVGAQHRMLSTYLNALARHPLGLEEVAEPSPRPAWAEAAPDEDPVPIYLVARCRRVDGA
jgi:SAM-dependent methyltransferase